MSADKRKEKTIMNAKMNAEDAITEIFTEIYNMMAEMDKELKKEEQELKKEYKIITDHNLSHEELLPLEDRRQKWERKSYENLGKTTMYYEMIGRMKKLKSEFYEKSL